MVWLYEYRVEICYITGDYDEVIMFLDIELNGKILVMNNYLYKSVSTQARILSIWVLIIGI